LLGWLLALPALLADEGDRDTKGNQILEFGMVYITLFNRRKAEKQCYGCVAGWNDLLSMEFSPQVLSMFWFLVYNKDFC